VIKSTQNIFEMMFQLPVEVGEPKMGEIDQTNYDVSGIIGMNGDVDGSVVISFPMGTAQRLVSIFTGAECSEDNTEDLSDAIGEIANMIAGGAKAQFEGMSVSITCPSVVIGASHSVYGRKDVTSVTIPCSCDCGEFCVEIAVKSVNNSTESATSGSAAATS
jgi:chemotaxis protein CheX